MLLNHAKGTYFSLQSLLLVYSETFQPDGIIGNETFHDTSYISQPLVALTSFLGLPNKPRLSDKLSFTDVLKNMIDWNVQDEKKGKMSTLDKWLAVPMFLYHMIRCLFKLAVNTAKIFTEFLPGLIEENARFGSDSKWAIVSLLANFVYGFASMIHFIGRAITSPVKGYLNKKHGSGFGLVSLLASAITWGLIASASLVGAVLPLAFGSGVYFFGCLSALAVTTLSPVVSHTFEEGIVKSLIRKVIGSEKTVMQEARLHGDSSTDIYGQIPLETRENAVPAENGKTHTSPPPSPTPGRHAANDHNGREEEQPRRRPGASLAASTT